MQTCLTYLVDHQLYFIDFDTLVGDAETVIEVQMDETIHEYSAAWFSFYYMHTALKSRFSSHHSFDREKTLNVKRIAVLPKALIQEDHDGELKRLLHERIHRIHPSCYKVPGQIIKTIPLNTLGSLLSELSVSAIKCPTKVDLDQVRFTYDTCCVFLKDHGSDLHRLSPVDPSKLFRILHKTTRAVSRLHARKIAHMDLKPSNVLVDEQESVRLCDFGISLHVHTQDHFCTHRVTKTYRPPELWTSRYYLKYNPFAVDVWSLGMMFWNLLTNDEVIRTPTRELDELKAWYSNRNYTSTSDVETFLYKTALKMLAWAPNDRPTVSEILMDMNKYVNGEKEEELPVDCRDPIEQEWRCTKMDNLQVKDCWNACETFAIRKDGHRYSNCLDAIILSCDIYIRLLFKTKVMHSHEFVWKLAINLTRPWKSEFIEHAHIEAMNALDFKLHTCRFLNEKVTSTSDFLVVKQEYLTGGYLWT